LINLNTYQLSEFYTIAICTHNRSFLLDRCLSALTNLRSNQNPRILVIDNGSSDGTNNVCLTYEDKSKYVSEPNIGLSHARNRAIAECKTEYLVYLDDDAIPDNSWLDGIEEAISNSADVFGGPYTPYYLTEKPNWFLDEFGSAHLDLLEGRQKRPVCFSGGNMGWRLELLKKYRGFDPELGMKGSELKLAEETALQLSIQKEFSNSIFWFSPRMSMKHLVSREKMSLIYIMRRNFEYGRLLKMINPEDDMVRKSASRLMMDARFGLPLIIRFFIRNKQKNLYWKTFAARYLTLNSISAGIIWRRWT
jgi:glycosyltransferase involved in cell wall biosynthesis